MIFDRTLWHRFDSCRLYLGVWRGREGMALGDEKYRGKWWNLSHSFERVFFSENDKIILMIYIFLILRILKQRRLNLKNSYKPSKIFLQYNFLVPPNKEGFVSWRKINPSKSSPSNYSFLFFNTLYSFSLQTRKQSRSRPHLMR